MQKYNLTNTVAVVTRYYGGIKLGVRGLIEAYSESAEQGIKSGEIIPLIEISTLIICQYPNIHVTQWNFDGIFIVIWHFVSFVRIYKHFINYKIINNVARHTRVLGRTRVAPLRQSNLVIIIIIIIMNIFSIG